MQSVVKVLVASVAALSLGQVLAADENGLSYAEILPDDIIVNALPDMEFSDVGYDVISPDRIAGAQVDESSYPVIKVDTYSAGTSDPETVYQDMGDSLDAEYMVFVEPAADPEKALPKPTVVAFDRYSGTQVTVTRPSVMPSPTISTEDRIFLLINRPPEIQRELARVEERALREEHRRKRARIAMPQVRPAAPTMEVIEAN